MDCPICHIKLQMAERQGIEIDYCPQCRGIWLDRGELDKLIERTDTSQSYNYRPKETQRPYESHGNYKKDKKSSFLSDLFDFD
ncbi:MAG TPA: hypothetical protein DD738_03770 [Ruminiclostridium sp.]|jgi:hypothetical protein|nr:hypothetical protein [Ruminiclostridium sp.]